MAVESKQISNTELERLIIESGLSNAALARHINLTGRSTYGLELRYDSSSVNRWLRGAVPAPPIPEIIAGVLTTRLHRQVPAGSLFADGDFLTVPSSPSQTVETATALWRRTVQRRDFLAYSFSTAASAQAGWWWVFSPPGTITGGARRSRIGQADLERLAADRETFAELDRRFGGGHARSWLADYLDQQVAPMLHGRYDDATGRALFAAAADLTHILGYMVFDSADHGLGQRYTIQALGLAHHAGNLALGAYIMSNLANQHVYLGDGATAAQLARAGATAAHGRAPAALIAQLHTTEARGHALAREPHACRAALHMAERALERARPEVNPAWLGAASPAHRHGAIMHSLHDLGDHTAANSYAEQALDLPADSSRARALHLILHARVLLGLGRVEESCATATRAHGMSAQLRSRRLGERFTEYTKALTPYAKVAAVIDWLALIRPTRTPLSRSPG
ncbi:hypothetical protein Lfu02_14410 [Longispora fulva]|uniref:Tetratricopeptide (TPR) repeat protein n=1 Tax=Longispora fulva TaxID=619741 RepID=A0A8J7GX14_9ACTN|nr:hypothetical protein [Longispora fulva]MBG6140549.1 tetratricopeptide (TPR) repeat protein [Longispora fulva]GIG57069.1 hypothetical protein Lfu02_14410 [Longispora fulva]